MEATPPAAFSPASVPGSAPCSAHRLQLLRSWLLHFSTTLHGYFMTRVVHTTELQLAAGLRTATDLDQLLHHHQVSRGSDQESLELLVCSLQILG